MRDLVAEMRLVDKKFASAVRKEIRAAITEAGAEIVAKVRASASWSSRIPGAVSLRPNFTARSAGVRIVVNRRKAPHAGIYELGNKGASDAATFTHPVFGKGEAVQATRPFFFTSIERQTPDTERRVLAAIDQACRDAGFR